MLSQRFVLYDTCMLSIMMITHLLLQDHSEVAAVLRAFPEVPQVRHSKRIPRHSVLLEDFVA